MTDNCRLTTVVICRFDTTEKIALEYGSRQIVIDSMGYKYQLFPVLWLESEFES